MQRHAARAKRGVHAVFLVLRSVYGVGDDPINGTAVQAIAAQAGSADNHVQTEFAA
jgi:hypothetical protein